jgi:DNA-binding CsgD family transcriptional regulator
MHQTETPPRMPIEGSVYTATVTLSMRETQCLDCLTLGQRVEEISQILDIKAVTVSYHIANAKRKLHARTREQAVAAAIRMGLI